VSLESGRIAPSGGKQQSQAEKAASTNREPDLILLPPQKQVGCAEIP